MIACSLQSFREIMKTFRILCILGLVCGFVFGGIASAQKPSGSNPPFALDITANLKPGDSLHLDFANTAEDNVKAGSMMVVGVRRTNRSDHALPKTAQGSGPQPYLLEVRDERGNTLERKTRSWIRGGGPGVLRGSKDMFLQPGESETSVIRVSYAYDMSKPGIYTIQAYQHVSSDPTSPVVRSNTIKIRVSPASK